MNIPGGPADHDHQVRNARESKFQERKAGVLHGVADPQTSGP